MCVCVHKVVVFLMIAVAGEWWGAGRRGSPVLIDPSLYSNFSSFLTLVLEMNSHHR